LETLPRRWKVTASAPLLQADRADVATTFTAQQLTNLPNLNRQFQSYELLTPGTSKLNWQHASARIRRAASRFK